MPDLFETLCLIAYDLVKQERYGSDGDIADHPLDSVLIGAIGITELSVKSTTGKAVVVPVEGLDRVVALRYGKTAPAGALKLRTKGSTLKYYDGTAEGIVMRFGGGSSIRISGNEGSAISFDGGSAISYPGMEGTWVNGKKIEPDPIFSVVFVPEWVRAKKTQSNVSWCEEPRRLPD